jgi:hypothetical protein
MQRKTKLPKKDYKTFAELASYARERALISARRRGHQEFAYWCDIRNWAEGMADCPGADDTLTDQLDTCIRAFDVYSQSGKPSAPRTLATYYAHAVHLRYMLLNRGEKPPCLSLKWLREAAEKL